MAMPGTKHRGSIVAIDGPDGVGKTTQVQLLKEYFKSLGKDVHATSHSGGTPIGQALRKVSLSDHARPAETDFYISLAMHAALAEDLNKRKRAGEVIIVDRSPLAMLAYNGYGNEMPDKKLLFDTCERMLKELQIDLLIHLGAPANVIDKRRESRGVVDYFESKSKAYHERVRQGYAEGLEFMTRHPELRAKIVRINADGDQATVHQSVVSAIDNVIGQL